MDITTLLSSAAVSAVVSVIITFTLKTVLKSAIEHRYKVELENIKKQHHLEIEKLKSQLAIVAATEREMTERRMSAYPKVVSLVYRTRNMCRDIAGHLSRGNLSLVDELTARAKDLEESLYEFRLDLQRDLLFDRLHKYKNLVINFGIRASDVKFFIEKKQEERAETTRKELSEMFKEIDGEHLPIINAMSSYGTSQQAVPK